MSIGFCSPEVAEVTWVAFERGVVRHARGADASTLCGLVGTRLRADQPWIMERAVCDDCRRALDPSRMSPRQQAAAAAQRLARAGEADAFPVLLRAFRERAGRSRNRLAHEVGVDPSYLTRIEQGSREPPRAHIVEGIARRLRLSLPERNRLLLAAGYAPASLVQLGRWDACLQAVSDVLNDSLLSEPERDEFRQLLCLLASRWRARWPVGRE